MIYKLVKLPVSKLSAQMPTSEIACNKLAMRLPPGIEPRLLNYPDMRHTRRGFLLLVHAKPKWVINQLDPGCYTIHGEH